MTPTIESCPRYNECSAPLCPLDPDLSKCVWFVGEAICLSSEHCKHRWINKQKSITKRQTKSYLDVSVTHQQLYDASRPKNFSEEQREAMKARIAQVRNQAK